MTLRLLVHPAYVAALGLLCGAVGTRWGWRAGHRIVLPAMQGAVGFTAFFTAWHAGGPIAAAVASVGWAVGTTVASLVLFSGDRERIDERVLGARRFREQRFAALDPHTPARPRWDALLASRTRTVAPFLAAALASANLLSLVLGALLLNAMNAYVVALVAAAERRRGMVRLLAWDAWHLARAAALCLLGSACAAPLAATLGYRAAPEEVRWLLYLGGIGLVLDLLLELLAGPTSRAVLGRAVALGPRTEGE